MLNSTEHEISTAHKTQIPTNEEDSCFSHSNVVFFMLINVKMPTSSELKVIDSTILRGGEATNEIYIFHFRPLLIWYVYV